MMTMRNDKMTTPEIRSLRAEKGLYKTRELSIWTGGCEGGEYEPPFCLIEKVLLTCFTSSR
jgi:hypothetical protein